MHHHHTEVTSPAKRGRNTEALLHVDSAILAQRMTSLPLPRIWGTSISKSGPKATKFKVDIPFLLQESRVEVPFLGKGEGGGV